MDTEDDSSLEKKSTTDNQKPDEKGKKPQVVSGVGGKKSIGDRFSAIVGGLNIYFLLFILIILIGAIITFIVYTSTQQPDVADIETQELTQEAVDELVGSDSKVGDPKQLLTVESDSVFTGKVLIRDGLDVAGPIKVGGSLSLPGITVSGDSAFDKVTVNTLNISGDANVQGQLNVNQGLTVSGPVTFSSTFSAESFSIQSLTVEDNLEIKRHIDSGGGTPSVSGGNAIGSGGTVTISGTDTAGTITVNVGSGAAAGVLASISFVAAFDGTPHVVITPVAQQGSASVTGNRTFYLSSRTTTGFSVATSSSLPGGTISFDYIVID